MPRSYRIAALADQRQRLALLDVEADAIDGADLADDAAQQSFADREQLLQPDDFEDRHAPSPTGDTTIIESSRRGSS